MPTRAAFVAGLKPRKGEQALVLRGRKANITIHIDQFARDLGGVISPRLRDLMELAACVAAADQATGRGDPGANDIGERWRRRLRIRMAVRDLEFWSLATTMDALADVLNFVSEDEFEFEFGAIEPGVTRAAPWSKATELFKAQRVLAFSGGLDSFAGAAETILADQQDAALITLASASKLAAGQATLVRELNRAAEMKLSKARAVPFELKTQRHSSLPDRERTQRTRSFGVAAAAAATASVFGLSAASFYENGVVSINLPLSIQSIGARATRTTHPATLAGYSKLVSLVLEHRFDFENPFLWKTKADVVSRLQQLGVHNLIGTTVSCGSVITMTAEAPHCGLCSQCIDRRVSVLAAQLEDFDPASRYRSDVLLGARDAVHLTLAEGYYRRARELSKLDEAEFLRRNPEVLRALPHIGGDMRQAASKVCDLHHRHAREVLAGVARGLQLERIRRGSGAYHPPKGTMLSVAAAGEAETSAALRGRRDVITIVHISDIHFVPTSLQQDEVLNGLADDLGRLCREGVVDPDLVVVTGDIVNRGAIGELKRAEEWIGTRLMPAADLAKDRLVLVPGNHDVDRGQVAATHRAIRKQVLDAEDQELLTAYLTDPDQRRSLLRPLGGFVEFARRLEDRRRLSDAPWTRADIVIRGRRVRVGGLSSACFAYDRLDKGNLVIGTHQLLDVLGGIGDAELVVAAVHHPLGQLADFDEGQVKTYVRHHADLVLAGHVHTGDVELVSRLGNECLWLTAGAAFSGFGAGNSYAVVEWDFSARAVRVRTRRWTGATWRGGPTGADGFGATVELPMPSRQVPS
jgi:3',5'-cyclic AMP phosphodiesterase CpdA/7-cyano-7-deazaguanine synthase in queuosine biosynthesis